MNKAYHRSNQH